MQTETTYTGVEVSITIGFDELEALIRDGEVLAHPEDAPNIGIIYDQRSGANSLVNQYDESEGVEPVILSQRDLIEVLNGETAEWDDHHPADIDIRLEYEAERLDGAGPTLTGLDMW